MPKLTDWFGQGVVVYTEFNDLSDPRNPTVPIWKVLRKLLMRAVRDFDFNWRENEDEDYEYRCVVLHRGESWIIKLFIDESFACREETLPLIRSILKRKDVRPYWIEVRHRRVKVLFRPTDIEKEKITYRIEIYPRLSI
ncbi:hypothetical protein A2V54_03550 [candidate division WWE3 bacterium RBG_19FT_COMBO_53_11]|uniref:Uncharacterized protein n=1 Tax=candidate division WWE3 bacterium RBG_19FT_COMBO_53_11 TaxID=1802613 RepID=A0A1F4UHK5_UNCKA|nr:MAG: hypothetical protein A2155_00090 [candidate division WWE3 bacterium RBG_16_52_45]OGC44424.1 MAG: hypothetical protein A2V54_03550 [candidate division WWE3 bacterium RBG_19FT_COMBO_53_11]